MYKRQALDEERLRQENHEALRVDFATKAKALHEYVVQQQAAINGLTGSFEEQSTQVQSIGDAFQTSRAQCVFFAAPPFKRVTSRFYSCTLLYCAGTTSLWR